MILPRSWSGWVRFAFVLAGATLSCGGSAEDGTGVIGAGGTAAGDAADGVGGAAGSGGGGQPIGGAGGVAGNLPPVMCGGVQCAAHADCCLTSSQCFDPAANPGACTAPTQPGPQGQKPCGASSQCAPGEYCEPSNDSLCLGPGFCVSKTNCGWSSPPAALCGCNGVTYPDVQTACAAGVSLIGDAACGEPVTVGAGGGSSGKTVTFCATGAQCAPGEQCCGITGLCYDPSKPVLCSFPPAGTSVPCIDDTQCIQGVEYCKGPGCTEPGGCALISGSCTGELAPVCGCNGKSYTNEGCAAVAGTRVAHDGQCP
jgi:hypothetical protein